MFEKATRTFAVRVFLVDTGTVAAEALINIDSADTLYLLLGRQTRYF